jgi:hypothetical protein
MAWFYSEQVEVVAQYGELDVFDGDWWGYETCDGCMRMVEEPPPYPEPVEGGGGEPLPYITQQSDTGSQWNSEQQRYTRSLWYQVWKPDSTPWTAGGTVTENWVYYNNPCNYEIQTGVGSLNQNGQYPDTLVTAVGQPTTCPVSAEQSHFILSVTTQRLYNQAWQFSSSGISKL